MSQENKAPRQSGIGEEQNIEKMLELRRRRAAEERARAEAAERERREAELRAKAEADAERARLEAELEASKKPQKAPKVKRKKPEKPSKPERVKPQGPTPEERAEANEAKRAERERKREEERRARELAATERLERKEAEREIRREQGAVRRQMVRAQTTRIAQKTAVILREAACYSACFVMILLIIFGIVSTVMLLAVSELPENAEDVGFTTYIYSVDRGKRERVDLEEDMIGYIDFADLAERCGFSITGDGERMRFTTANGEYVIFTNASSTVEMNGTPLNMGAPARADRERTVVPLSFVTEYLTGAEITEDGARLYIDIHRSRECGFALKGLGTLDRVDPSKIPE